MLSNFGRVYKLKAYEIPEGSRTSKGMNIVNILPLMENEKICTILPCNEMDENHFLVVVTKNGTIKRTSLDNYLNIRKTGIIAISLEEDDMMAFAAITNGNNELIIATKKGMAIHFDENDARPMGRSAHGVRAIKLREGDEVVAMSICNEETVLLTVTETGYGRKSNITDYRLQSRAGKGITNYRTAQYGDVAAVLEVTDNDDIIMIASDGVIIRVPVAQISTFSRPAKGVRVKKVPDGVKILSVVVSEHNDDEITDVPEAAEADAGNAEDNDNTEE
jgi:DNA gyrase subunit A